MTTTITIDGQPVGSGQRPFIVAEMSGNHHGSLDRALRIVDAVAEAGAHALKMQTYTPDTITIDADTPAFRISAGHALWGGQALYQLYQQAHTPYEWHQPIFDRARSHGLTMFSAPFDPSAIELLESLETPAYKIASAELVDLPLIRLAAATGKPLIISTGMANMIDIAAALDAAHTAGATQVMLLVCTSAYPAPPQHTNLRRIPLLADTFGVPVGLSDHTPGTEVAIAAVALGAVMIEKHVTLDRGDHGPDAAFSMTPAELGALVGQTGWAWQALGTSHIGPTEPEQEGLRFRRSLYVVADVKAGDTVTRDNIRSIRPAGGLAPVEFDRVLGRTFTRDATRGTPLAWEMI